MCQNSVFIKMSQLLRGSSIFYHISGGGGEGASKKYLMRLGGAKKNFVTQIVDILPKKTTLTGT